tara:strand:- start:182 stop:463 length:282 start_codon:yes stop_codon:yes gene_type:complete
MRKNTHTYRLLEYLKSYGNITTIEAIRDLGNTRLAASINVLRNKDYIIESVDVKVPTRWNNKDGKRKMTTVTNYIYKGKVTNTFESSMNVNHV